MISVKMRLTLRVKMMVWDSFINLSFLNVLDGLDKSTFFKFLYSKLQDFSLEDGRVYEDHGHKMKGTPSTEYLPRDGRGKSETPHLQCINTKDVRFDFELIYNLCFWCCEIPDNSISCCFNTRFNFCAELL